MARPQVVAKVLKAGIKAQQPLMIWGPPGVGKSDVVRQVAADMKYNLIDLRLALLDPVDLRGIPFVDQEAMVANWAAAGMLPNEQTHGKHGILFLDEIVQAPQSVQGAALQLVLDRKVGEYELPEGWYIAAAGNRTTDRSGANRMIAALGSRFTHIDFDVHIDDWTAYAVDHGLVTEVLSFIRFRPGLLHEFDKDARTFPCPRTWEFVSKILGQDDAEVELELIQGSVGTGAAGEFIAFLRTYRDLPNPDAILLNPAKAKVPTDPSTLYALTGALSARAEQGNWDRLVEYTKRLPVEFQVVLIRDSVRRVPELANTRTFSTWAADNSSVLM